MPRILFRRLLATGLLFLATAAAADAPALTIADGWLRATPTGASVGGGYARFLNAGDRALAIVGVESPVAASAELHSMRHVDGMMQMRHLERLEVPAHGSAALAAGGDHLMLFGLRAPLVAGQWVPITLVLDDGRRLATGFIVRDAER